MARTSRLPGFYKVTVQERRALVSEATGADMGELDRAAQAAGAAVLPSGAGGGDVVLIVGEEPPDADLESSARRLGLVPLSLTLGARGVHALAETPTSDGRNKTLS